MDQILSLLRSYLSTGSIKATARMHQVSKNTVRHYLARARAEDEDLARVLALPSEELRRVLYPDKAGALADRRLIFDGRVDYWIRELGRVGVTRQMLFEEYRVQHPEGYGQSQFYKYLAEALGRRDLTLPLRHKPGGQMQLDFAGKPLHWVDAESGEVHACQVLLAVLPFSQYTFAIALPSQRTGDFIFGINEALRFFGRRPRAIVSDNLKAFVIQSDNYEPDFNALCVQLAAHYEVDLQATRPGKPKDKASVESAVSTAYTRLYAPLRNRVFHSPEGLNAALREQLRLHNERPFQKRPGSRARVFAEQEQPLMRALPAEAFLPKTTVKAKVQRNYHVFLGERKNFYSVPYAHVGKQATVVYDGRTVEIFIGAQRIATHRRLHRQDRYVYQTNPDHMPRSHQQWREAEGYDAAYFRRQGAQVGPATAWAIDQVLRTRIHEAQAYRACIGTLRLADKFSPERLEAAAVRLQAAGKASYTRLKNILVRGLDQVEEQPADLFSPPRHDNIRGPDAYQ